MKTYKKIITLVILSVMIMINSICYADEISKETIALIEQIQNKIYEEIYDKGEQQTAGKIANIIREVCNDDLEKIQSLQIEYTSPNGEIQWHGSYNIVGSIVAQAVSQAYNNAKAGIPIDDNPNETENAKKNAEEKIRNKFNDTKMSDKNSLQELDDLLKDYITRYGNWDSSSGITDIAEQVSAAIKKLGYTETTAYEQYSEQRQNAWGNNNDTSGKLGTPTASADHTPDEVINEAQGFIDTGKEKGSKIDTGNLKIASDTLYNILLTIGIFLAVAIGMYLGLKFMMASAEDKAKVKESLIPYIAGCVVIFGAFAIWKLAVTLLAQL